MAQRIAEFDLWQPGYGGALVSVYVAGTTTYADIYTDEALTITAENPQSLGSLLEEDGTRSGKFNQSIYTNKSYFLVIEGEHNTGIVRPPLTSLIGEDASKATVTVPGSATSLTLEQFGALQANVMFFGAFVAGDGGVPATNTSTMELAIAALTNGGEVIIPAGTFKINSISLPEGIVIKGQGREATTLQSIIGDKSFILTGDRCGFRDITLDGSSLSAGSVGIKSVGKDEIVFENVLVTRFQTGVHLYGGKGHVWNDFSIENVETGIKLHGDMDAGDTNGGKYLGDLIWTGGLISVATTIGISLSYEDALCHNIVFQGLGFEDCVNGTAVNINGAQFIQFQGCWWRGNTVDVNIVDDTAEIDDETENDVIGVRFMGGRMNGGEFKVTGTCQDVVLHNVKLENVDFKIETPIKNHLILQDCFEDEEVTITGEAAKLLRAVTSNNGASFGVTTNNTPIKAWSMELLPGQQVYLEAKVIAKGRNVVQRAIYHIGCGAYRPGASLTYDTQTANFTAGAIVTGASSGAKARIQADTDGGTTGTLTLTDIQGDFIDNEIIADDNGTPGSATANGTLSYSNVTLDGIGNENIRSVFESDSDWAAAFVANGPEVELRVTGDSAQSIEWNVYIDVVTT